MDVDMEMIRKHRREHFDIKVENIRESCCTFQNEIHILVTHNGYQYQGIAVDPVELEQLVEVLQAKLKEIKGK